MPLETARAIDRMGFRRWYERQLVEGHVWLVTALLCAFTVAACLEMIEFRELGVVILTGGAIFAAGLIAWHGVRRYMILMGIAEHVASQTTCPQCRTYARFRVLDTNARMRVCCRKCGQEWVID
jgi:hypothetical protein